MKALSMIAVAATIAGVASACTVRTDTVERPAPVVATAPAPGTVVYANPAPSTTTTTVSPGF
jgi:hypothetical protein